MHTGRSLNNATDLARSQRESSLFEFRLHISSSKDAPITKPRPLSQHDTSYPIHVKKEKGSMITYKSPFFLALLQSLSVIATSPKLTSPLLILLSCAFKISIASAFERVMLGSRQLLGRRLSLCLMRRWRARILPGWSCDCDCDWDWDWDCLAAV